MINYTSILVLGLIALQTTVAHADWSLTKIITTNHYGSPAESEGFHPTSFLLEKSIDDKQYYSMGILKNSEGRTGIVAGYTKVFRRINNMSLTGNLYLSSNYKDLPFITPIPTIGVRYHLTKKISINAETIPVPSSDPYVLFITGMNFKF